jgi:Putative adhesin
MQAKSVLALGGLSAALLSLTSCIVGLGDWERFSKDFHSSYPLKPGGKLSVETFNGSIDISSWDEDSVDVSGTKYGPTQEEADNLRVDVDHTPDSVYVHVQRPTERRNNQGARLTIKVPRNTQLERLVTSNSSIHTEDGVGPSRLRTSNGSIRVEDLHGELDAETSNSSIELAGVDGNVRVHSSNGHIRAEHVNGSVEAETSNNSVNLAVERPDKSVRIDTSNSGVELDLPKNFSSGVHVDTNNGPITLRLAEGTNARISARTSNSSIDTEFEIKARGELSRNRLEGDIGSGGPLIDLSTSNGSIRLLRR